MEAIANWGYGFNERNKSYVGKLYCLLSGICMSFHIIIVKSFPQNSNPYRITNNEMVFSIFYAMMFNKMAQGDSLHPRDPVKSKLLFVRGILGVPGFTSAVVGSFLLPSKVYVVMSNCNIIFATFLGSIISKKQPNSFVIMLMGLFIIGVVIMTYPELLGLPTNNASPTKECILC